MADLLQELERLAGNATTSTSYSPTAAEINRWMALFQYTRQEAIYLIQQQRNDITRDRISDSHWELVSEEREAMGYDREAYEHELRLVDVFMDSAVALPATASATVGKNMGEAMHVVRLGGLLRDPEMVMEIAGLRDLPRVVNIVSEEGIPVRLCAVDGKAKQRVVDWLVMKRVAKKDAPLSKNMHMDETMGIPMVTAANVKAQVEMDTILPQHRAS
jgi:hypothetical protein